MPKQGWVHVEKKDGLINTTIASPPLNILNGPLMAELTGVFEGAIVDKTAKVLLLKADGKFFSAGADIDEHKPGKVDAMIKVFHGMFRVLDRVPFPTIAFVDGAALGGGCELAMGFDIILATEEAKFAQPEINLGFIPPVAAAILPGKVGWGNAMEFCCSGLPWKAPEALARGLVQKVFPRDSAGDEVDAFLAPLLKQSPITLRLLKKAMRGGGAEGFLSRLDVAEHVFLRELMETGDVREGLAAFYEKRRPIWKNC